MLRIRWRGEVPGAGLLATKRLSNSGSIFV